MMIKINVILICIIVFGSAVGLGQSTDLLEATNWGESVQGVQLSFAMTNSVFKNQSSTTVTAVTRNASTNDINVKITFPTLVFDVLLTDATGKSYHVTTPYRIRGWNEIVMLKPGEKRVDSIPVTFGESIEPGDYTLKASRGFTVKNEQFRVVSNSLKVQIVK